ncbi:MAG: hypothetical protein GXX85_03470 [Ignavibacteria bacterium]|nr:hypothetical protein [Ignavibacteria bacterium]
MPYRNLPNTDAGLAAALRKADERCKNTPAGSIPFSPETQQRVKTFSSVFLKELDERGGALANQGEATRLKMQFEAKCRMAVSHFFQVFNLGVAREKYKVTERSYFKWDINQEALPALTNEADIIAAAENIINGETLRVAAGCVKMQNPSSEEVKVHLDNYTNSISNQTAKKETYEKEQKDVDKLRAEALDLVTDIWDETEFTYRKDAAPLMRRKAREFGVVYALRPGEPEEPEAPAEGTGKS